MGLYYTLLLYFKTYFSALISFHEHYFTQTTKPSLVFNCVHYIDIFIIYLIILKSLLYVYVTSSFLII